MDEDLDRMSREQLLAEAGKLRAAIRAHRDSSGQDLCWHHPALWGLLPEKSDTLPAVPAWPEFMRGCVQYRQSLDRQVPDAPRTNPAYQNNDFPIAIIAADAAPRTKPSNYPEPFASRMAGREKRPLGDVFGLSNFGVNLTRLRPGTVSALRHAHTRQDEFVYILAGHPVLLTDEGETPLAPGMCAGFRAGSGNGHQLANRTGDPVLYLEIGDRSAGDAVTYPDDDLKAELAGDGKWRFVHKDGTSY